MKPQANIFKKKKSQAQLLKMRNPQRHLCKGDLSRGRVCLDCSKRDSPHHAKVTFVVVVPVTLVVVVLFALLVVVIVTLGVVVECIMRDSSHNAKVLTVVDVILLHYCQNCQLSAIINLFVVHAGTNRTPYTR